MFPLQYFGISCSTEESLGYKICFLLSEIYLTLYKVICLDCNNVVLMLFKVSFLVGGLIHLLHVAFFHA